MTMSEEKAKRYLERAKRVRLERRERFVFRLLVLVMLIVWVLIAKHQGLI